MKYRCQTPLRADEFDLRPELLRRREASKDPVSSQQGDQLLSVASDLRNLVYNSAGDKAARSASFRRTGGSSGRKKLICDLYSRKHPTCASYIAA